VQDLDSVGGASGREGLRRTAPRREKFARPRRGACCVSSDWGGTVGEYGDEEGDDTVGGVEVQGVASS
jgi:hypothetical protein